MARRVAPVYWKPRTPTRVMRERAWARKALEREQALKSRPGRRSLLTRLRARLRARLRSE